MYYNKWYCDDIILEWNRWKCYCILNFENIYSVSSVGKFCMLLVLKCVLIFIICMYNILCKYLFCVYYIYIINILFFGLLW